jgi:toxin ParE1/3/4
MARQLEWSPEAIEDVIDIASYIERDSAWYAQAVVSKLKATADSIPEFPDIGRVVPEMNDSTIRERFVYSYRLIYRIEASRILLVAVIHGSRLLSAVLPRNN